MWTDVLFVYDGCTPHSWYDVQGKACCLLSDERTVVTGGDDRMVTLWEPTEADPTMVCTKKKKKGSLSWKHFFECYFNDSTRPSTCAQKLKSLFEIS